jgi:ElaB/YqjD/DUF883 family membrane-anchored ribosome-binding protein
MDPKLQISIIQDAAQLVQKTAELQAMVDTIPQLEKQAADLALEVARLQKVSTDLSASIVQEAQTMLQPYIDRQVLTTEKVAAALDLIRQDPAQVVGVLGKIAASATAQQVGAPGGDKTVADVQQDPIAAFAMG